MYDFLLSLKTEHNSFLMHENGEDDLRAVYIVMVTATVLDIATPELIHGVADYVASCQTYEGGFGANPHAEAHGGYFKFFMVLDI